MHNHDLFQIFIHRLNDLDIRYMITGSVATIIYGEPRLTHDIDLVIDLDSRYVARFWRAFPLEEFYCPPREVILLEIGRRQRGHFNLIHHATGFKADIYASCRDELHLWGLENRVKVDMFGEDYWLAPVEYVIIRKLEFYREGKSEKHLRDIAGVLSISSSKIDFELLSKRIREKVLEKEWDEAREYKI